MFFPNKSPPSYGIGLCIMFTYFVYILSLQKYDVTKHKSSWWCMNRINTQKVAGSLDQNPYVELAQDLSPV